MKQLILFAVFLICPIAAEAKSYTLKPTSMQINAGGAASCDYTIDTSDKLHDENDWIGFYVVGSPNEAFIDKQTVGRDASGTITLSSVSTFYFPQTYEFRMFKGRGFAHLACTSDRVTISPPAAIARNPDQILVVYNSSDADSTEVANYYKAARKVPNENMLGLKLGTAPGIEDSVSWSVVTRTILPAIRAKLTALEATHRVYYIQLIYRMPYLVDDAPALVDTQAELGVNAGLKVGHCLCSHLQDPFFDAESAYLTGKPMQKLRNNPMRALRGHESNFWLLPELNTYFNLLSLSQYRQLAGAKRIYSCTHLDSISKTAAKAIVDHNLAAEATNGPQGTYYFDVGRTRADLNQRYPDVQDGHDYLLWDVHRAREMAEAAGFATLLTEGISATIYRKFPPVPIQNKAAFFYGYWETPAAPDAFSMAPKYVPGSVAVIVEEQNSSWRTGVAGAADKRLRDQLRQGADAAFVVGPEAGGAFQNYYGGFILRWLIQGGTLGDAQMSVRGFHWNHFAIGEGYYQPRSSIRAR